MNKKSFYLTTTLPYVNAPLHIGHALEFVRADALARYHTLLGEDVYFNTGTDEHGQKIFTKALEANLSTEEFTNQAFATFQEQVKSFGIADFVHYIRTTDEEHIKGAQAFWKLVADNGYIYKKNYQAKYCVGCEAEKTDSELVDGLCPDHPNLALEIINEENYFFKLSALQQPLLDFYTMHPDFIVPDFRFNEIKNFVKEGLNDFSISRLKEKMSWGIEVPGDSSHVMYVWFDALSNYITTLGWPHDQETFDMFWVNGTPTQYCGKDNTRFQGIIWQAMLMAAHLPNTHKIIVNGHITGEGGIKMSKSLGNVINPLEIARDYGVDALRLYLLKEVNSFEDSSFTIERFKNTFNSNLANGLGNLSSRILTLSEKYLTNPEYTKGLERENGLSGKIGQAMEASDLQRAVFYIWEYIGVLDTKITQEKPFSVIKTEEEKGKQMILELIQGLYEIAYHLKAFLPETSAKLITLIENNKKPETPLFLRID